MIDMMQVVKVELRNNVKRYYSDLGYNKPDNNNCIYPLLKDLLPSNKSYIKITCDYCGNEFQRRYCDYSKSKKMCKTDKDACPCCRKIKIRATKNSQKTQRSENIFQKLYRVIDSHGYILLTSPDEYTDVNMNIKFICPIHGERTQSLCNMIYENAGCRKCADDLHAKQRTNSAEKVLNIINNTDNNILLNPEDYINENIRNLNIQCSCGSVYLASLTSFLNGKTRCSKCAGSESAGEKRIRQLLDEYGIRYVQEYCYKDCKDIHCLPFDFKLIDYNICIEYDGKQHEYPWFGQEAFEKTILHDNIKTKYCKDHNIKLIRISYRKYKNIQNILEEELGLCKRNSLIS